MRDYGASWAWEDTMENMSSFGFGEWVAVAIPTMMLAWLVLECFRGSDMLLYFIAHTGWRNRRLVKRMMKTLPDRAVVVDAGAGTCDKKPLIVPRCRYIGIDSAVGDKSWDYSKLDYVAPLEKVPLSDEAVDAVLCLQVLEHVKDPLPVLSEFRRILKPGGRLWMASPLIAGEHQVPHDYGRYTRWGLEKLAEQTGFEVESCDASNGFPRTVVGLLAGMPTHVLRLSGKAGLVARILWFPVSIPLRLLVPLFDWMDVKKHCTLNYESVWRRL